MVEDKGRGVSPQWRASSPKDPTLLPVQRSVLFSRLFFSLVKKMLAHREGELWEERVGYSFDEVSLSSCMILNCLSAKQKQKQKKIQSLTLAVCIQIAPKPRLSAPPGRLSSHWTMRRHRLRLHAHTHRHTHSHTHTHTDNCPIRS